jgi:hypothetical protein
MKVIRIVVTKGEINVNKENQILSRQATGRYTTVLGGIRWCVMVLPNGSETCLPLQQSLVQRLEDAFYKFPPIQRTYRSLGQATRALR